MSSSPDTKKLAAFIAIVIVIAGAAFGVIMLMQPSVQPGGPEIGIATPDEATNISLNEIKAMETIEGFASFQNSYGNIRGQGNYSGIKVSYLLDELVGGMESNQILTINATDGYAVTFPYSKVYPNETIQAIQGDMILGYEYNGTEVPDWEDGYRIIFLTEDGYYSTEDANQTTPSEYFIGAAGPTCIRMVDTLKVETPEPTALTVEREEGTTEFSMSELKEMDTITGTGGYVKSSGIMEGPHTYTGITFETVLSATGLIPANYTVEAMASEGYTTYYNTTQVEPGYFPGYDPETGDKIGTIACNLSLAWADEGGSLPSEVGPLRAVLINEDGNFTDGHFWNKDVVRLTLIEEVPDWQVELDGVDHFNISHDDYYAGASCSHHQTEIKMNGDTYNGLPLYVLVAAMDGGNDIHFTFNSSLALATHYNVTLYDGEGMNVTLSIDQIADNMSTIVAGWKNDKLLEGDEWPIKLVTPNATLVLGGIVKIEMVGWEE